MLVGCSFEGATPSISVDARPIPGCEDWTSNYFDACTLGSLGSDVNLDRSGTYLFSTDTGTLTDPFGGNVDVESIEIAQGTGTARVIFASNFTLGANSRLRAIGEPSFIVASPGSANVAGEVDVSSTVSGTAVSPGAGADVSCVVDATADGIEIDAGGAGGTGGAGGSFVDVGGAGGGSPKGAAGPTLGGQPAAPVTPTALQGGCPGGSGVGRISTDPTDLGLPGSGGRRRVDLRAGRGDGRWWHRRRWIRWARRTPVGGGGGGGSGGMIVLEGATVILEATARLFANGGGGSGASVHDGTQGTNGNDAVLGLLAPAPGGLAGTHGHSAAGGPGGFESVVLQSGPDGTDAGGGGGGGIGAILIVTPDPQISSGAQLSPAQE